MLLWAQSVRMLRLKLPMLLLWVTVFQKSPSAGRLRKKTMRIVKENIVFSIFVKVLIIIGCAVGIFDENAMWLAVFGDVGVLPDCSCKFTQGICITEQKEKIKTI